MQRILKRFAAGVLAAGSLLAASGCGGGGGGSVETTTVSGVAVKGPITGALVRVYKLKEDGTQDALLGSATTIEDGSFTVRIPKSAAPPYLVAVSGRDGARYLSESTGGQVPFAAAETFHAALDSAEAGRSYAVTPLTEAAYQQVQRFLTETPTLKADARVVAAANARVAALFAVRDLLADPAGDPSYAASLRVIDRMVENAKAAGATGTVETMNLLNRGLADVSGAAYQALRTALVPAAGEVKAALPALTGTVDAVLASLAAPPAEPVWADSTAPEQVTGLKAVAQAESATAASVTLSWASAVSAGPNRVAGYRVYRDGREIASVTSTSYLDGPLATATSYRYSVAAFDAAGNRSASGAELSVATPRAPNLTITVGGQLDTGL